MHPSIIRLSIHPPNHILCIHLHPTTIHPYICSSTHTASIYPLIHLSFIYLSICPASIHTSIIYLLIHHHTVPSVFHSTLRTPSSTHLHTPGATHKASVPESARDSLYKSKWVMESCLMSIVGGHLFLEIKLVDEEG